MITKDSGVEYEQHLNQLPLSVVVVHAETNKLVDIMPHLTQLLLILTDLKPRTLVHVG